MDRKHYKELAKASISHPGQKMTIFAMNLPVAIVAFVSVLIMGLGSSIDNILGNLLSVIGFIGTLGIIPIMMVMSMGTIDILLTNAKYDRAISFKDWWEGKQIKAYFGAFLFGAVVQIIKGVPSGLLNIVPILGTIAGMIVSYIIGVKLIFVQLLKLDHPEIGLVDALKISFNMTGEKDIKIIKEYLLLTISLIPQYLQTLIPVWNVIYALPVIQLTYIHLYLEIAAELGINDDSIKEGASDIDDALDNAVGSAGELVKAGANVASGLFGKLTDKLNDIADKKEDSAETDLETSTDKVTMKAPKLTKEPAKFEEITEYGFELAPENNIYSTMVDAIRDKSVVDIIWNESKARALPIDIVKKSGLNVYNFFVQMDGEIKPVQIPEADISEISITGKHFDPTKYVTWKPNWQISRDWEV